MPILRKSLLAVAVLGTAAAAAGFLPRRGQDEVAYRFVTLERGDLEAVVSATGTLSAVRTVQVGTQISGLIDSLLVDFNDTVRAGQVIARLDTTLLESALRDAEASVERATAELRQARRDLDRLSSTHAQGITSDADFNKAQYTLDVASAGTKSAEAAVARARQNLGYATIRAPVSGTVVERDVDVGQTVAASLSAPKLFLIANDLSEMQILASVAESDIGQLRAGQTARFRVKAYPARTFAGSVKQVRLQSATEQNVVSYTVVVAVKNPEGILLPGMTATVDFLTASATNVLKVPNAALRFRPTQAMLKTLKRPGPRDAAALYTVDAEGALCLVSVRTGISDGQSTQVEGPGLAAGAKVVAGTSQAAKKVAETSASPFQAQQPRGGPPGPPPPGGF